RVDIVRAAGRKGNNDAHRPGRIGLRPRETRHGRKSGSARGHMQKISAGKIRFVPPLTTFYYLAGDGEHTRPHCNTTSPEVDHQLEFARLHDRQVARFRAFENLAGINTALTVAVGEVRCVTTRPPASANSR